MNKLSKILEQEGLKKKAAGDFPPGLEEALQTGDPAVVARYYADKNDLEFALYFSDWAGESYEGVSEYYNGTFFRDIEFEATLANLTLQRIFASESTHFLWRIGSESEIVELAKVNGQRPKRSSTRKRNCSCSK